MIATTILNGVLGFTALKAILFCMGNIENAEKSPMWYPFIEIFLRNFGVHISIYGPYLKPLDMS